MDKKEHFINEAKKVHGDKYDYSKIVYNKAHDKMCIICPEHGEFWQDKYSHLNGCGCPKCARKKVALSQTYTQEEFIQRCLNVWGDYYTYDRTIYNGITNKVTITCKKHGDFNIIANDFINGHGCSICSGTKRLTTEEFITRAKEIHGDKYDYSKVNYVNSSTKVCIICPEHGEFWQTPVLHLRGYRCHFCYGSVKKTKEQFINEAKKVHGDKYDYSKVNYKGNKHKICIICNKHGEFSQTPLYHLQGHGCKLCNESLLERDINLYLTRNNFLFIREKKFDWLGKQSLDFYIPSLKIAIECQGDQHFKNVIHFGGYNKFLYRKKLDENKYKLCKDHNIKIIYIVKDKNIINSEDKIFKELYKDNVFEYNEFVEYIKLLIS